MVPLVIKERYLKTTNHVSTEQLYSTGLTTPGETRVIGKSVWEAAIAEGVRQGLFGIGDITDDKPVCRYFREAASIAFSESEVLIREEICRDQMKTKTGAGVDTGVFGVANWRKGLAGYWGDPDRCHGDRRNDQRARP